MLAKLLFSLIPKPRGNFFSNTRTSITRSRHSRHDDSHGNRINNSKDNQVNASERKDRKEIEQRAQKGDGRKENYMLNQ